MLFNKETDVVSVSNDKYIHKKYLISHGQTPTCVLARENRTTGRKDFFQLNYLQYVQINQC